MAVGIKINNKLYPDRSSFANMGICYVQKKSAPYALPMMENAKTHRYDFVYDTIDMSKAYKSRRYSNYYVKNGNVNIVKGAPPYADDIFRLYQNMKKVEKKEDFHLIDVINKRYDFNILYDGKSHGLEIDDYDNEFRYSFSTRHRYIQIIDHIYIGGLLGLKPPSFNYKFNYVKKIGVCLPTLIYGDIADNYPPDDQWLFTVKNNEFYCRFNNYDPPAQEIVHSKFEMYHKQTTGFIQGGSDCLIVDLSEFF